jgi:hypothetical protein
VSRRAIALRADNRTTTRIGTITISHFQADVCMGPLQQKVPRNATPLHRALTLGIRSATERKHDSAPGAAEIPQRHRSLAHGS